MKRRGLGTAMGMGKDEDPPKEMWHKWLKRFEEKQEGVEQA